MRKYLLIAAASTIGIWAANAQDDQTAEDKGFLVNTLQGALSGAGRDVQIEGFAGALSSVATMDSMTISDADGIWLELRDVTLDWNRSALLRGRVEVTELNAALLDLKRLPKSDETAVPDAQASGFSLPELPVSVEIDLFGIDTIRLGQTVMGEPAEMSLTAAAQLIDGSGTVDLRAERKDGKTGRFIIDGSYDGATTQTALNIDLTEGDEGIIARLIDLPDRPPVALKINGTGPLDDFTTDLALATDGKDRLAGQIALRGTDDGKGFRVDLGGDVTALFLPQYAEFFGPDVALKAEGVQADDGALNLETFDLTARSLDLAGRAALNANGWPTLLDIEGRLASPDGAPVLLPLTGDETRVDSVDLKIALDPARDDIWTGVFDVQNLDQAAVQIDATRLDVTGTLQGDETGIDRITAALKLAADGLNLADPSLAQAAGDQITGALDVDYIPDQPLKLQNFDLTAGDLKAQGDAVINGLGDALSTDIDLQLDAPDLARFSGLAGRDLTGQADVALNGTVALGGVFDIAVDGTASGITTGQDQIDTMLDGQSTLTLDAARNETGTTLRDFQIENPQLNLSASGTAEAGDASFDYALRLNDASKIDPQLDGPLTMDGTAKQTGERWDIQADAAGPFDVTAQLNAALDGADMNVRFDANLPDGTALSPQLPGALNVKGIAATTGGAWDVDVDASGPYDAVANVKAAVGGADGVSVAYTAKLPEASVLSPQLRGPLNIDGTADQTPDGWRVDVDADGPLNATATVGADIVGAAITADFKARMANAAVLAPQLPGALDISGTASNADGPWSVDVKASGPLNASADAQATLGDDGAQLRYDLRIPNVARLVPEIRGPLNVTGTATQSNAGWRIDTDARGPSGITAQVDGLVGANGRMDLAMTGRAQLGLANPFIAPRNITGPARFDLALKGPASLGSLSGTITAQDARLSTPTLPTGLQNIDMTVALGNQTARLDISAAANAGGTITLRGPIALTGGYNADLDIALNRLRVVDPQLYKTSITGGIAIDGPLRGGARISGDMRLGETKITVPSSGLSSIGEIPDITHIKSPRPVQRSLARAGLTKKPGADDGSDAATSGPAYPLDLTIRAPNRIFVRGRGLDAELGGNIKVTGTTARAVTVGRFDLVRGRLDILGRRFGLDTGAIQLQGGLNPTLRFVATTQTDTGTASVVIEGEASAPKVSFISTPPSPEDEVLAKLFFNRDASQLSAFQALQLASAVAELTGRGGEGVVSKIRRKSGLDDLDITTDAQGQASVRAGKYISRNVYTDVTVGGNNNSSVSLNLDISPSVTARGKLGSNGDTSVGVFFERDY